MKSVLRRSGGKHLGILAIQTCLPDCRPWSHESLLQAILMVQMLPAVIADLTAAEARSRWVIRMLRCQQAQHLQGSSKNSPCQDVGHFQSIVDAQHDIRMQESQLQTPAMQKRQQVRTSTWSHSS